MSSKVLVAAFVGSFLGAFVGLWAVGYRMRRSIEDAVGMMDGLDEFQFDA